MGPPDNTLPTHQTRRMILASFLNPRGHKTAYGEHPVVSVDHGWPEPHLIARPNDAIGAAIIAYAKKWKGHPDFPESPFDTRRGEIFLRDLGQPEAPTDEVPKYRVKTPAAFVGCVLYTKGQEISSPAWPKNLWELEPMNESAERVVRYVIKFGAGRNFIRPPYEAGKLHLENPALFGRPESAHQPRWAGSAA